MLDFLKTTGFYQIVQQPLNLVMILIACILMYLAIVKKFEPLLLLTISFGMLLTNLPGAELFHESYFAGGQVDWASLGNPKVSGLIDYLYLGVKLGIYPCLIFMGVGAMTDFGPLIANPKSLIFGAAAQLGIFVAFALAMYSASRPRRRPPSASSAARMARRRSSSRPSSRPSCSGRSLWRHIRTWRSCRSSSRPS